MWPLLQGKLCSPGKGCRLPQHRDRCWAKQGGQYVGPLARSGSGPSARRDPGAILRRLWHGTRPHICKGVPDSPTPESTSPNNKYCTLILVEIGFCIDFGFDIKKNEEYSPLLVALKKYWDGWSSSPSPLAKRELHSPRPTEAHRRLHYRPPPRGARKSQQGHHRPRHGPQR